MATRRAFRPDSWDRLERREVMSRAGVGLVGALGDSYTDEYQFYPPSQTHARNWVEILAYTGKASFGPLTSVNRGEPRDRGFATDWARFGATSTVMAQDELPGLARQVATGRVGYAWIFVGGNDFLYYLQSAAAHPPTAAQATVGLAQVEAIARGNLEVSVATLLAANPKVKLVLGTVPSLASLPIVRALATTPAAQSLVAGADQALAVYNAEIRALAAASPRIAVADLAATTATIAASGPSVSFGGTTLTTTTASNDYHSLVLADGLHVGTVGQGLIADAFLGAIDGKFGANVPLLTPTEIVSLAALVQRRTRHLA